MEKRRHPFLPPLWLLTVAGVVFFFWLLAELRELVFLLVVSFSLAYIIQPALRACERVGMPRPVGVLLVYVALVGFIVVMALTAIPSFVREYRDLVSNLPRYIETVEEAVAPYRETIAQLLPDVEVPTDESQSLLSLIPAPSQELLSTVADTALKALVQGYSLTLTVINFVLLPFLVFYLAVDFRNIKPAFLQLFPILQRERVNKILSEIDLFIAAFVKGQMLIGFILTILYGLGLFVIGVELWFFLAVVAGFGNMVPYLGTIIGVALSTIMTIVTFKALTPVLFVWGVFTVVQVFESYFLTPRIIGEKVGLSPLLIILALLAGGSLFGLLGIVLAIPAVAVLRVLAGEFRVWCRGQR